jgi:hypothetical protein
MDEARNPFDPFAAHAALLVGRSAELQLVDDTVTQLAAGRSAVPVLLAGRSGAGTSTLLGALGPAAERHDWHTGVAPALPDEPLREAVGRAFARALTSFAARRPGAHGVRAAADALVAFAPRAATELPVAADPGHFDEARGDLARDLRRLLSRTGDALRDLVGRGFVVVIDDLHAADPVDAIALVATAAEAMRDGVPVAIVAGGTPTLRWFARAAGTPDALHEVRPLDVAAVTELLRTATARAHGGIDDRAIEAVAHATAGYPQLVVLYAQAAWRVAGGPIITGDDVAVAAEEARTRLAQAVLGPAFALDAASRRYLRAVAEAGDPADSVLLDRRLGDTTRFGAGSSPRTELRDALVRRGLLSNLDGTHLGFAHPAARSYVLSWQ